MPGDLTIVVCAYNMARELPRTISTLSRAYQRGTERIDYRVVVLDNGSSEPVDDGALRTILPDLSVVRPDAPSPSPAAAINAIVKATTTPLVGLWIDGARMASPGLIAAAWNAHRLNPGGVVGTVGFHLGPDVQMRSVAAGYDQAAEDDLLAATLWREDGYGLFRISVLAGSSAAGWFGPLLESNGVFLTRPLWDRLGGLDERFRAPGGGFVNLDFWERAVAIAPPTILLGEGTFHQVHGGAATGGSAADRAAMAAEYEAIRGRPFARPRYASLYSGSLDAARLAAGIGDKEARRQAFSVGSRVFKVGLPPDLLATIHEGTLRTRYKNLRLAKNPFDLAIYLRLIARLMPRTIIEIGTSEGGSAVWFRDQCRSLGLDTRVLSIDIKPPALAYDGVSLFAGNSSDPAGTFPTAEIAAAPHPWLVTEDSSHQYGDVLAVLRYFAPRLAPGDYAVVEDGTVADLPGRRYDRYADGPNRAVAEFLRDHGDDYEIDAGLCDTYGHNVTFCPNAWLRRRALPAATAPRPEVTPAPPSAV